MRKQYWYSIALFLSLFIYLFYRTEKTLVNEIVISMITFEYYLQLKQVINEILPLNSFIIYSLPEGLWVYSFTIISKNVFIRIANRPFNLVYLPLLFAVGLEVLQLLQVTKGRFDVLDILTSILFWMLANFTIKNKVLEQSNLFRVNTRIILFLFTYAIVYLAHVQS